METGTILNWNEEKGFGFIAPQSGGKTIFAHINDYSRMHKSPFKGLEVQYALSADQKGRKCAVKVRPLKGNKKPSPGLRQKTVSILLFSSFSYGLFVLVSSKKIPIELAGLYAVMSGIAFILYAKDKYAAQNGHWRTSERTLHALSLFGGWPGAAIAQSFLRHKSQKASFRFTYWITVMANCGALYWFMTQEGSWQLKMIIKKITFLIENINIG